MENFRNYYEILGVAPGASADEIKQTFRQLARKYHPDLNPGDKAAEETFKTIGEAYEVLSDVERRSQYDKFSRYWQQDGFPAGERDRPSKAWGVQWGRMSEMDFSQFPDFNIFIDELLGKKPPSAQDDYDAGADGYERDRYGTPPRYRNNSADYDEPAEDEDYDFYGAGEYEANEYAAEDYRSAAPTGIRDVEANLEVPLERAYSGGLERIRLEDGRAIELDMPGGLLSGQQIRLKGQGIQGGDLYLKITVPEHRFYRLDDIDIHCTVPVSPAEAVLGAPIEVPTLDGLVQVNLPQGVRSGQRLRLAEKGYPNEAGRRGDQIVEIAIAIPRQLSPEEQALYEKLYQLESFSPRRDLLR